MQPPNHDPRPFSKPGACPIAPRVGSRFYRPLKPCLFFKFVHCCRLRSLRVMASKFPTDVCPACLQNFDDARVLSCLHSVCKACIDKITVTATDGVITCPICRASTCLPQSGAGGLPKDVLASTASTRDCSMECGMCDDDKPRKKPTMWCKQCGLPLCDHHALPHIVSASSRGEAHLVGPLSLASQGTPRGGRSTLDSATPMCTHHGEALKYHCGTCDVAICGACGLIGDHKKHDNVRLIKDILDDRKKEVNTKMDTLENDVVPKLEHSIQAVDNVSTELARRADEVRTDIRKAGKQAVEMVEAHVEQMVQEVDDLELSRCKVLDRQRDELKSHLDAAKNAIHFRNRVMELTGSGEETQFSLLHALETRTTSLTSTTINEQPQHHSRLTFKAASDRDLATKTKEGIGKMIPCQASARHSRIEGSTSRRVQKGKTECITIRAKDRDGENLTTGDDVISTRCLCMQAVENTPSTTITDNGNGSYTIACTYPTAGTFQLEVYVNGEKMATDVNVTCVIAFSSAFDPKESHPSITISADRQKASVNQGGSVGYLSVLGSTPMRHGHHTWKIRIGRDKEYHKFGIASKPLSAQRMKDHSKAYCWCSWGSGAYYRDGVQVTGSLSPSSGNDTFQFDFDCDCHTLRVTNLRSGESSTFSNLPDKEYYQFSNLCLDGNSVEFVD